jgi:hypothetical protein
MDHNFQDAEDALSSACDALAPPQPTYFSADREEAEDSNDLNLRPTGLIGLGYMLGGTVDEVPGVVDPTLPPGWHVVSDRHQLVGSPRGSIYSRRKARTREEQLSSQADFDAWLVETGCAGNEGGDQDWAVPTVMPGLQPLPDDNFDRDDKNQPAPKVGSKRRETSVTKCHYIGHDEGEITGSVLTCPNAESGQPDYVYPFCSHECMAGWALYEVQEPTASILIKRIEHRAGRKVVPAPSWYETLITGVGRLKMAAPIDTKGQRMDDDDSHTHQGHMLPDNATVYDEDIVEDMEDDAAAAPEEEMELYCTSPPSDPPVACHLCATPVDPKEAAVRIRLHTRAVWAFCSEFCATRHPEGTAPADGLMTLVEWLDLAHRKQTGVLRRDTWDTEKDDIWLPEVALTK